MATRTGDLGKLTEKRHGDRVALFGEGSEEEPPTPTPSPRPEAGSQAPRAGPADAAARWRPERAGPRVRGSAHRLVPAGVPARGRGPDRARRELGSGDLGGAGATRQRRSPARLAPGLWVVLRTSQKEDPLRVPPLPQAEKLPPLGREPGRAGACGRARRASSALCAGGAGVGRKLQTRAACCGSPPPCRRLGGSAELRRGHTPRDRAENANLVLTPLPGCGGGGHLRSLGQLRGNSLLHPGVGQAGDNAWRQLPIALAFGCPLRLLPRPSISSLPLPDTPLWEMGGVFRTFRWVIYWLREYSNFFLLLGRKIQIGGISHRVGAQEILC